MNNEKEIADREQVLEQAFAAATNGNMDQAFALVGQVANGMLASRNQLWNAKVPAVRPASPPRFTRRMSAHLAAK